MIKTDNNPLAYILTAAQLDTTEHQWLAAFLGFQFTLKNHSKVGNWDADTFSRRPYSPDACSDCWMQLTPEGVQAFYQGAIEAKVIGVAAVGVPGHYSHPD